MATKTTEGKATEVAEEMVTVELPLTMEKQDDVFVGVNGETLKIKRGERVEIPKRFYEVLANSEKMDKLALTRKMQKPNVI